MSLLRLITKAEARTLRQTLLEVEYGQEAIREIQGDLVYPCYRLVNGWEVTIFNDAGEWDYVHAARLPTGEAVTLWPDDIQSEFPPWLTRLIAWHPSRETILRVWRWDRADLWTRGAHYREAGEVSAWEGA